MTLATTASPRRMLPAPLEHGFTLTELMVTLAIAGILAAMAVPAMQNFLASRAVDAQAQELTSALRLARSEALKRGMEVSVCAASTSNAATCSGDTAWTNGWVVFFDRDVIGSLDGTDAAIRVQGAGGKAVKDISTSAKFVTFRRNGILLGAAGTSIKLELQPNISSSSSGYAAAVRTVCINNLGRVLVNKGSLTTCP